MKICFFRIFSLCTGLFLASGLIQAADPNFVEPDVDVQFTRLTEQPGSSFGWVGEDLGDLDGDGASDFIVTAPFLTDANGNSIGRVYIYSGADGNEIARHDGNPGEFLGFSGSNAGDLDGDGINDYAAGSIVRVVAWSGNTHEVLWETVRPGENFGFDLDTAGDIDGDGLSEVIVGASAASINGPASGAAYLLSGSDGSILWTQNGAEAFDRMGSAVGRLADVDADGVRDVVVGVRSGGLKDRGQALALSGVDGSILYDMRPAGLPNTPVSTYATFHAAGGGDVDGDGLADIFVGDFAARRGPPNSASGRAYVYSGANGAKLLQFEAENNGDGIGPGRIVPDADGDGLADIFVAAFTFGPNAEGIAYLHSGADGELLRTMTGTQPNAFLGVDAFSAGDVNFDGIPDYVLTGFEVVHVILGN
ncbi:MAG: integrin alpha [Wenzhouxiangellaceae bacterium]